MVLARAYNPQETEPRLGERWEAGKVYHFNPGSGQPVYSIDTPPPTVSGNLHLGHVYSYSHADFMARFFRMNGWEVFYPMGFDDNGLPTERLVEKRLQINAPQVGRQAFIEKCLEVSAEAEQEYRHLWQRLGLSIDWRYQYRTIDEHSRRTAQASFIDLHHKGLVYRQEAPEIWCPECQTAIAQAELNDLDRETEFVTLDFRLHDGGTLPVATTRPELLPACVAVFVHPDDQRFTTLIGQQARVPLFNHQVPILADLGADPQKGTGAVMCCTFGDTTDVAWWRAHHLPVVEVLSRDGHMTALTADLAGLPVSEARRRVKLILQDRGLLLGRQPVLQSIRVHERCDTPVEYIVVNQWFIRVLDFKDQLLEAGQRIHWHPEHMFARYRAWVENLNWDWCISRQRYFGVPFPVWYCQDCGAVMLADENRLPVEPMTVGPGRSCACGGNTFIPEGDVMDTWATSSLSPQIVGQSGSELYEQVYPFSLRPQAHEIIRTWAFYTIVQSLYHEGQIPWKEVLISGWGLAGEGMGKISKSRGGGPMAPVDMIDAYSADALRYWAASTGTGRDALISLEKIQMGSRLVTKLWNVARFCERFIEGYQPPAEMPGPAFTPADRWILARLQILIRITTSSFLAYDYAGAKSELESFFWRDLADNYLEMCKQRLYDENHPQRPGAQYTLQRCLLTLIQLFAPLLPYVTDEIFTSLFVDQEPAISIHRTSWPRSDAALEDEEAAHFGETLVAVASAVRRYKSEHNLPLGLPLNRLQLATVDPTVASLLTDALVDLASITRAASIQIVPELNAGQARYPLTPGLTLTVER